MSQDSSELEQTELDRLKQGTYSDILFVLLPFLAILLQRLWTGEVSKVLLGYEISTAAAILGGLSISKFIQGLVTHPDLGVKKERIVFVIALTIFCVVVPALILTMKLVGATEVPPVIAYIQPILLVVAIALYVSAIRIIKSFEHLDQTTESLESGTEQGNYNLNVAMAENADKDHS